MPGYWCAAAVCVLRSVSCSSLHGHVKQPAQPKGQLLSSNLPDSCALEAVLHADQISRQQAHLVVGCAAGARTASGRVSGSGGVALPFALGSSASGCRWP